MSGLTSDLALFAAGSALLAWWSRKPLRHPGSHGFYRFFAWEGILALAVLNREPWGTDPFSAHQIASWILLLASIALAIAGYVALRTAAGGKQRGDGQQRGDDALYAWEDTSALVTSGVFAHVRHPMYTSLLALAWGAFLQHPSWTGAALAALVSLFLVLTARADERECLAWFGDAYAAYMQRTRRFIPYLL